MTVHASNLGLRPREALRSTAFSPKLLGSSICCGAVLVAALLLWDVRVFEMRSPSMEPLIYAKSRESRGDIIIASRLYVQEAIRINDLVLVKVSLNGVVSLTVRRVVGCPGSPYSSSLPPYVNQIPKGYFCLAAESANGLDSRQHGLFAVGEIRGKVVHVIRARRGLPDR